MSRPASAFPIFASVHCFPVEETTRAPFLRQRDASGISEVTHTSAAPMRSAIQVFQYRSAADAVSQHPSRSPSLRDRGSLTLPWREMDSNHRYPVKKTPLCGLPPFHPRNSPLATKTDFFATGTDGSNPSPSRRESIANLTPADAERPGRSFCREGRGRGASYPREPAVRRISRPQPRCSSPPARIMSCLTCCEEWS
jgi:hypothetical protein